MHKDVPLDIASAKGATVKRSLLKSKALVVQAASVLDVELSNIERSKMDYEQGVKEREQNIERYRERIANEEAMKAEYEKSVLDFTARLAAYKPKDYTRAIGQIMKHKDVQGAYVSKYRSVKCLTVVTYPLFTRIRKESGARQKKRALLGVYRIILIPESGHVHIENLTFSGRRHWATGSGSNDTLVCQGDWGGEINKYMRAGLPAMAIHTVIQLLKAADTDGSAYTRAHAWREERRYAGKRKGDSGLYMDGIENQRVWPHGERIGHDTPLGSIVFASYDGAVGYARLRHIGSSIAVEFLSRDFLNGNHGHTGDGNLCKDGFGWNASSFDYVRTVPRFIADRIAKIETGESNASLVVRGIVQGYHAYEKRKKKPKHASIFEWLDGLTDKQARSTDVLPALMINA